MWPVVAGLAALAAGSAYKGSQSLKDAAKAGKSGDRQNIKQLQENEDIWDNLKGADYKNMTPEQQQWLSDYTAKTYDPTLADTYTVDGTAFDGISTDPRLKEQQLAALASLSDIGKNGMTVQDRANMAKMQAEVGQADRGRREAIQQNMAARGMGGSGMALLAQMQNAQSATDRSAQQGLDIQGMSQARALQALQQSGVLAGNIRGQDFSEQARVAEAKDAVNKFNAQQQQQGSQYNTSAQNAAAQYNTGAQNEAGMYNNRGRQAVAGSNVDAANHAQYTNNVTIPGQRFGNSVAVAQGRSGANTATGAAQQGAAARNENRLSNQTQGWFKAADSFANMAGNAYASSDERVKKDIKDVKASDVDEFLKALKSKSFKYKNGKGDSDPKAKIGFIMQDIEKTKLGKEMSRKTEDGMKAYDTQSLQGVTLAALKRLSDKIDEKGE